MPNSTSSSPARVCFLVIFLGFGMTGIEMSVERKRRRKKKKSPPRWTLNAAIAAALACSAFSTTFCGGSRYLTIDSGTGGRSPSGLERRKTRVFWMLWIAGENESSTWNQDVGFLRE